MPRKRAKTEGSIYWSEARKKWVAQLPVGRDGRRPLRTADTEAEALALLRQLHTERAQGRDLSQRAETVAELLEDYLDTIQYQVRAATLTLYRRQVKHITDRIGKARIDEVSIETAQRLANALAKDGASPGLVRAVLDRLRVAYKRVVPKRVTVNPVDWDELTLRKVTTTEREPLDVDQLRWVVLAADDVAARAADARYGVAWWMGGLLGMRRGEIAGATWRDLNWERGELRIRQGLAFDGKHDYELGVLKTENAARTLPMGPLMLTRLKQHWEAQQAERRMAGIEWKEHGLIICEDDGRPLHNLQMLNDALDRLQRDVGGLPHLHPHLLRHTCATLLSELGYSDAVIGRLLGHTRGRDITRRYVHGTEKKKRAAIEALETFLFPPANEAVKEA